MNQNPVKAVGNLIYGLFSGLVFLLVTILTLVLLVVTPGQQNRRRIVSKGAALIFFVTGITPSVSGREHLPAGQCVVVANHASYLDGIILTAVLPPRFSFVIKREMDEVPFISFLLRRIGSEFVDRFDQQRNAKDTRRIMQTASNAGSLAFFPEGTFRVEAGLRPFHSGAFKIARRGNLKLVPVVIRGSRHILPAEQMMPVPGRLEVIIKPSVDPGDEETPIRALMAECRARILEDLDEPDLSSVEKTRA